MFDRAQGLNHLAPVAAAMSRVIPRITLALALDIAAAAGIISFLPLAAKSMRPLVATLSRFCF